MTINGAVAVAVFVALTAGACSSQVCPAEAIDGCLCADGRHGVQQCNSSGTGYGPCNCSGTTPDGGGPVCSPMTLCSCPAGTTTGTVCRLDGSGYDPCTCGTGPRCGDFMCDAASETCGSCPMDCGSCTCSVTGTEPTGPFSDSCAGSFICRCPPGTSGLTCPSGGTCGDYAGMYDFWIWDAMLASTNAGAAWDADGSPPDPYVKILVNGVEAGRTAVMADTYTPAWGVTVITVSIPDGANVELDVEDSDAIVDDFAFNCVATPINASELRSRDAGCTGATGTLTANVFPH